MAQQRHDALVASRFAGSRFLFSTVLLLSLCAVVSLARCAPRIAPSPAQSAASDGSELILSSTQQFLLIAPDGKETGFDPVSKTVVQSIPRSAYATEGLAADDYSGRTEPPSYSVDIFQPLQGTYHLKVFGAEKRKRFGVTFSVVLQDGSMPPDVHLVGLISSRSIEEYELKLSTIQGSKLVVAQTKHIPH